MWHTGGIGGEGGGGWGIKCRQLFHNLQWSPCLFHVSLLAEGLDFSLVEITCLNWKSVSFEHSPRSFILKSNAARGLCQLILQEHIFTLPTPACAQFHCSVTLMDGLNCMCGHTH